MTTIKKTINIMISKKSAMLGAFVISLLTIIMIISEAYGIKLVSNKLSSLIFFSLNFYLIVRFRLLNNKYVLLLLTFWVWMGATAILAGAELTKAWGGQVSRSWLVCIFAFLTAYILIPEIRRTWLVALSFTVSITADIFYCLSLYTAYRSLFDSSFEGNMVKGIIYNGRLHAFGNANTVGALVAITFITGLLLIISSYELKNASKLYRILFRIAGVATLVISLLVMTMCRSRGGILCSAIGTFGITLRYSWIKYKKNDKAKPLFSIIIAVVIAGIVVVLGMFTKNASDAVVNTIARKTQTPEVAEEISKKLVPYGYDYAINTLTDRTLIWPATIRMMNEKPVRWLIGITAPQGISTPINYIYEGRPELSAVFAHNGYLQDVFMYGIPGALLLLVILICWSISGVKTFFNKEDAKCFSLEGYVVPLAVMAILLGVVEIYPFPFWTLQLMSYVFFCVAGSCCAIKPIKYSFPLKRVWQVAIVTAFAIATVTPMTLQGIMNLQKNKVAVHTNIAKTEGEALKLMNTHTDNSLLSADYWINNCEERNLDANEELLSIEEIRDFNSQNRKRLSSMNISFALEDIGDVFNGKVLKSFINDSVGEFAWNEEYRDKVNNIDFLEEYMNLDAMEPSVDVRFGYSVDRTTLRRFPGATKAIYEETGTNQDYDMMAVAELMPMAQVSVLYATADNRWIYILTEDCGGWVPSEYVACCNSKEEWLKIAKDRTEDGFVVVTAKSISLGEDYDVAIPMGTTMAATQIMENGKLVGYKLRIPVGINGTLSIKEIELKSTEGLLYNSYLPYNQANFLNQVFKFLGDDYGWAGTNNNTDCSLLVKQVYATFGINMPRNSAAQANVSSAHITDFFLSTESRKKLLKDMPAGTLMYFQGHIMMYLGMVDDIPYCISSVGPLETVDMPISDVLAVNQVIVSDMEYTTRANGVSWLNSLEKIVNTSK